MESSAVSKLDAVPQNIPTEAMPLGYKQLANKESDAPGQEPQYKGAELKFGIKLFKT